MTRPYSEDLRERVVRVVESGTSRNAAAKQFDVSISFVVKLMQRWKQRGTIKADKYGGWKKSNLAPHGDRIRALVMENCDITIDELCVLLAAEGIEAKRSTLGDFLLAQGLSRKKRQPTPPSRSALTSRRARATWRNEQPGLIAERLVFLDETWARTNMARRYGRATARRTGGGGHSPWSLEDNHVHCRPASRPDHRALRFRWPDQRRKLPCLGPASPGPDPVRGATSSSWTTSPPTRSPAYTRPLRRSAQSRSTCRPNSPDLNPIEQVFAKLKAILRKVGARTVDDLWRAIGNALDEFSPTECRNYLVNAGYSV